MTRRSIYRGRSYRKRREEINRIYEQHIREGLSNREIWRRYVYPVYAISESTFYNLLRLVQEPPREEGRRSEPTLWDIVDE